MGISSLVGQVSVARRLRPRCDAHHKKALSKLRNGRPLHARKFNNRIGIDKPQARSTRAGIRAPAEEGGSAARAESPPAFHDPHFEVYDHHDYTEDKKAAMEGLATLLRTIVE